MNIDTHLIERYLQDEPVYADADAWIFRNTDPIDPRRHDVVHELCRQVCGLRWPCFNRRCMPGCFRTWMRSWRR